MLACAPRRYLSPHDYRKSRLPSSHWLASCIRGPLLPRTTFTPRANCRSFDHVYCNFDRLLLLATPEEVTIARFIATR